MTLLWLRSAFPRVTSMTAFLPDKAIDLIDEAASKSRLTTYVEPAEIKTLTEDIDKLEIQKEQAIKNEAYEKAGDIKKRQQKKREKSKRSGKNGRRKNIQKADGRRRRNRGCRFRMDQDPGEKAGRGRVGAPAQTGVHPA